MATTRSATTTWHGSLFEGSGRVELESSGLGGFDVTWASRAEDPAGRTSPEELIARRPLVLLLDGAVERARQGGHAARDARDHGRGHLPARRGDHRHPPHGAGHGPRHVRADDFVAAAEAAKTGCPVSQALTGTTITLTATLALMPAPGLAALEAPSAGASRRPA